MFRSLERPISCVPFHPANHSCTRVLTSRADSLRMCLSFSPLRLSYIHCVFFCPYSNMCCIFSQTWDKHTHLTFHSLSIMFFFLSCWQCIQPRYQINTEKPSKSNHPAFPPLSGTTWPGRIQLETCQSLHLWTPGLLATALKFQKIPHKVGVSSVKCQPEAWKPDLEKKRKTTHLGSKKIDRGGGEGDGWTKKRTGKCKAIRAGQERLAEYRTKDKKMNDRFEKWPGGGGGSRDLSSLFTQANAPTHYHVD